MIGGDAETVTAPRSDLLGAGAGPGRPSSARTAARSSIRAPSAATSMPGPAGAGHFVKMIHNGIEYGMMQFAFAEGFDIMKHRASDKLPADERFDLNLADIAEVWRRGSVVTSWLLDLTASALAKDGQLEHFSGNVEDSRRRPLDDRGGDRGSRAGRRAGRLAVRALPLAPAAHLRGKGAVGHAARLRRPRRSRPRNSRRIRR